MFKNDDGSQPKIVYTVPYYDYLRFERWKLYFWVLVAVSILSNIFFANLAVLMVMVPKPLMNHILGITPEMARNRARNDAIIERYERFQKQEKAREQALAEAREKAYNIESGKKTKALLDQIINNPNVSEETARLRAFK